MKAILSIERPSPTPYASAASPSGRMAAIVTLAVVAWFSVALATLVGEWQGAPAAQATLPAAAQGAPAPPAQASAPAGIWLI